MDRPTRSITRCRTIPARSVLAASLLIAAGPIQAAERPSLDRLTEIGPALLACWRPSGLPGPFTVRLRISFRRDGTVLGQPQIVYASFGRDADRRETGRAIARALEACTPLRFSPALGGAVAGRPFVVTYGSTSRSA